MTNLGYIVVISEQEWAPLNIVISNEKTSFVLKKENRPERTHTK